MHRGQTNGFILLCIFAGVAYTSGARPLIVDPRRQAPCGGPLSLVCTLSTPEAPAHIYMSWVKGASNLCEVTNGVVKRWANDTDCHYDSQLLMLTVTLLRQGPQIQGVYTCKMRSDRGLNHNSTTVTAPACKGLFQHTSMESPAGEECLFYDVYPEAQVHWFSERDGTNLTASSTDNRSVQGANGLYNISSVLPRKGVSSDLRCGLSSQNSSHVIQGRIAPKSITGSGSCPGLHWAFLLAGLVFSLWE